MNTKAICCRNSTCNADICSICCAFECNLWTT